MWLSDSVSDKATYWAVCGQLKKIWINPIQFIKWLWFHLGKLPFDINGTSKLVYMSNQDQFTALKHTFSIFHFQSGDLKSTCKEYTSEQNIWKIGDDLPFISKCMNYICKGDISKAVRFDRGVLLEQMVLTRLIANSQKGTLHLFLYTSQKF